MLICAVSCVFSLRINANQKVRLTISVRDVMRTYEGVQTLCMFIGLRFCHFSLWFKSASEAEH